MLYIVSSCVRSFCGSSREDRSSTFTGPVGLCMQHVTRPIYNRGDRVSAYMATYIGSHLSKAMIFLNFKRESGLHVGTGIGFISRPENQDLSSHRQCMKLTAPTRTEFQRRPI